MIFKFDASVIDGTKAHELASFMRLIHEKGHKVDYEDPVVWEFIEKEVLTTVHLGKIDIDLIRGNHAMRDVRKIDRNYYRTLLIGNKSGMIDMKTLGVILQNDSRVVLENSHHDWCPIKKWIELVKNDRVYKDINRRVSDAVCSKRIIPEHAGGGDGTITNKIEDIRDNTFGTAVRYKVTAIFDSDKVSATIQNGKNKRLKQYLESNCVEYHEWKKREMENYIPLRIYILAGLVNKNEVEPDTTPSVWDYTDIGNHPYMKGKYTKDKLPKLADYIDKTAMKDGFADMNFTNPVDHHKITELQHIIFLLAKYI